MRTKHTAEKLTKGLLSRGFSVDSIHGNKSQNQRDQALTKFKNGTIKVLVATDVAARGLDIPAVEFVFNYDLPNVVENYVHRIGRTARAGAYGKAISFCNSSEMKDFLNIERKLNIRITVAGGESWEKIRDGMLTKKDRFKEGSHRNKKKLNGAHKKSNKKTPGSIESVQLTKRKKKRRSGVKIKKKSF